MSGFSIFGPFYPRFTIKSLYFVVLFPALTGWCANQ